MKILKNTTFIKTVLLITVILGHSMAYWSGTWITEWPVAFESETLKFLYGWIGSFHVYAFTAISGYIFAYKMTSGGYSDFHLFLINKGKRLLVPYFFVAFLWVIPISVVLFKWDFNYIVNHFIFCTGPSQLWFLWMLFDVFVIAWIFWSVFSGSSKFCWCATLFLFFVGRVGSYFLNNYFEIWTSCQYIVFFVIGIRLFLLTYKDKGLEYRINQRLFNSKLIAAYVLIDFLLYCLHVIVLQKTEGIWKIIDIGIMLCLHSIGAVTAILLLSIIADKLAYSESNVFKSLSMSWAYRSLSWAARIWLYPLLQRAS